MLRRVLTISSIALTLGSGCADSATTEFPPPQGSQAALSESTWITTDRAGAQVFEAQLGAQVALDLDPGLVALQVPRAELASVSQAIHDQLHRCGGFMLEQSLDAARVAAAAAPRADSAVRILQAQYVIDNAATVTALMAPLQESRLRQTIQSLADFPTRYHESETGQLASVWIADRWQGYVQDRADVTVKLIEHEETPQRSIALTIQGAKYPDEHVILGGHMDSINRDGEAAPGADDNAAGIAVLDEVARAALELGYRPDRTVTFYAYAAEEVGLVGSAEIAAQALEQDLNVVGVLQLDMTNYNPAAVPYLTIITDFTDATLNQFARQLIEQYVGLPWKNSECGYACSDHGSWQRRGFPVHFVHEATTDESNEEIHTARDTLALSNGSAQHSLHHARYAAAFMAETAKGGLPPVPECDANRPCPIGASCQAGSCVPSLGGAAGAAGAAGTGGSAGGPAGGAEASGAAGVGGAVNAGGGAGTAGGPASQAGASTSSGGPAQLAAPTADEPLACSCRAPSSGGSSRAFAWVLLVIASLAARRQCRAIERVSIERATGLNRYLWRAP